MKRRLLRNPEELRKVCDEIIAEHLRSRSGSEDEDFVDVLIRFQKREDLHVEITDDNLKALVLVMELHHKEVSELVYNEWSPVHSKATLPTKFKCSLPCKNPKSPCPDMQWDNGDAMECGLKETPI
ncbi:hypothetical protein QQ045_033226 [Rhodiola kirilowii]